MSKVYCLFLSLFLVSINVHAYEPVLDHQGMLYFNLSFDVGQTKKVEHDFGFRFDRALVQPRETLTMSQLNAKPAVFNLKLNNDGLKAFYVNGTDYSYDVNNIYVYHGAEGGDAKSGGEAEAQPIPEATAEPRRKINIPLGVVIGVLIGGLAMVQ
jgi:hypothetical protein